MSLQIQRFKYTQGIRLMNMEAEPLRGLFAGMEETRNGSMFVGPHDAFCENELLLVFCVAFSIILSD